MAKMTKEEIGALVLSEVDDAVSWANTQLGQDRADALKSYRGEGYDFDSSLPPGHSRVVTQEVLEVIEWMMPSLMRIFAGGGPVVTFSPQGADDVERAKQETAAVMHVWSQKNNGFMNSYSVIKDALLQKLGVLKIEWHEGDERALEEYEGLNEAEVQQLMLRGDAEVEKIEEDDENPGLWCVYVRPKKQGRILVDVVPPEGFLLSRNSRDIDSARFKAWRREVTISEVRRMGYDVDDDVGRSTLEASYNYEHQQRFKDEGGIDSDGAPMSGPSRLVWLVVAYISVDADGDGLAELRRVVMVENEVVEDEEVPDHPFSTVCPIPMPHKTYGMSIADLVMDLQLIKTTLVRQMLNNLYATNHPRTAVQADMLVSIDEMLDYRAGGIVRTTAPPSQVLMPLTVPFVAEKVLPVLAMFDDMLASRAGHSKFSQGLDPNVLNQTATGVTSLLSQAGQRVELIARIFAETGFRSASLRIHRLLRSHFEQGRKLSVALGEKWVDINPREWTERTDMTVKVGLGTGEMTQDLLQLSTIGAMQEKIVMMQGGANGPLVTLPNIYATASEYVEKAGLKSSLGFFTNPIDPETGQIRPSPPKPPDPTEQAAMAAVQIEQGKLQVQAQSEQSKIQLAIKKQQDEADLARWRAQQDSELAWWKARQEMALKGMKIEGDAQMKAAASSSPNGAQ